MAYIGKSPAETGQITSEDTFTATDVIGGGVGQRVFTLTADVGRDSDIVVSINGVVQTNGAFVLSGTGGRTLTFPAPAAVAVGDVLRIAHIGYKPTYTTVQPNSIDGTHLQIGTPAQGDFIYYDGTNYVKIAAGTSGQALLTGGSSGTPSWGQAGGASFESGFIRTNVKTNTASITFTGNENGMTAGPITVANNTTITVTNGSTWTIV